MRLLLAAAFTLAACGHHDGGPGVAPDGHGPTRSYKVADFTAVALTGSDDVDVRTGAAFSVRAEGEPAALDQLRITVEDGTLRVGRRSGVSLSTTGAKIFVTMPRIAEGDAVGSGTLTIDRAAGASFAGAATGSGGLVVRALAVTKASLSSTGSGDVTAAGSAGTLVMAVTGAGDIDARGVKAGHAEVQVAGSGSVRAAIDGTASVTSTGSGDVDLGARAHCSVSKTGSGSVTCGG